uniref:Uncharacterized protein n=1 Tax=Anopheles coluzzii TaxID=1518534 RepID=A0A8W7PDV9_ANOCL
MAKPITFWVRGHYRSGTTSTAAKRQHKFRPKNCTTNVPGLAIPGKPPTSPALTGTDRKPPAHGGTVSVAICFPPAPKRYNLELPLDGINRSLLLLLVLQLLPSDRSPPSAHIGEGEGDLQLPLSQLPQCELLW